MQEATHVHAAAHDALIAARTQLLTQLASSTQASLDAIQPAAAELAPASTGAIGSTGGPLSSMQGPQPVTQDLPQAQLLDTFEEAGRQTVGEATQQVSPSSEGAGTRGEVDDAMDEASGEEENEGGLPAEDHDQQGGAKVKGGVTDGGGEGGVVEGEMAKDKMAKVAQQEGGALDEAGPLSTTSQDDWDLSGDPGPGGWPHSTAPPLIAKPLPVTALGPASAPLPCVHSYDDSDALNDESLPPSSQDHPMQS